ncbi:60S acidic ribosomal protein P1-like isoform X2 [Carcharodon carcharias]|uniref:60S acidic ribosomal protein P1-like isoform X2 n=1 Tax=Carcharodon carcharias TaxID=13397 RepID=UPI001B7ED59D|nr:60S acidic ribosomal protein P1-like isoform X2 [Carcharodon carcharias]
MASTLELACIYNVLILHNDRVTVTALANIDINSLICNVDAGGSVPAAAAAVSTAAPIATEKKKVGKKREKSEESDDDMGFGLFD